jgi:hypothetical protein
VSQTCKWIFLCFEIFCCAYLHCLRLAEIQAQCHKSVCWTRIECASVNEALVVNYWPTIKRPLGIVCLKLGVDAQNWPTSGRLMKRIVCFVDCVIVAENRLFLFSA